MRTRKPVRPRMRKPNLRNSSYTDPHRPLPSKMALALDVALAISFAAMLLTNIGDGDGNGLIAAAVFGIAGLRVGYLLGARNRRAQQPY